ncbi:MAG: hypothetical protein JNN27_17120 [Planctomycetes bacterium]|nr:hypothetical protein [Planctomycetota bacterium]
MNLRWAIALVAAAALGCRSDVSPLEDVVIEGTSQEAAVEYVYFRVPPGAECAGVRIRSEGNRRVLSFVRSAPGVQVDSPALLSQDPTWEGMLRVEVPIDEAVLAQGGEMTLAFDGGRGARDFATFGYPRPTASDQPARTGAPSPSRTSDR